MFVLLPLMRGSVLAIELLKKDQHFAIRESEKIIFSLSVTLAWCSSGLQSPAKFGVFGLATDQCKFCRV